MQFSPLGGNGTVRVCSDVAGSVNFEDITKTDSKPNEVGLGRKGKTTPSVDLTPPAAADDLMVLF